MLNNRKFSNGPGQNKGNDENCLGLIYSEICLSLIKMGWHPKIKNIREFSCIYIEDVSLSIFILDGTLFVVKGDKLPPIIYKENLNEPEFDIIESINRCCNNIFTSPENI